MSIAELQKAFPNASRSTLMRNLGEGDLDALAILKEQPTKPKKRLRQSAKPLMNKLETKAFSYLTALHPMARIHCQDKTYRIANGLRYTPDNTALLTDENLNIREHTWEVKGKWVDGDSFPKLKMMAAAWPEIIVTLLWLEDGRWNEQRILP